MEILSLKIQEATISLLIYVANRYGGGAEVVKLWRRIVPIEEPFRYSFVMLQLVHNT